MKKFKLKLMLALSFMMSLIISVPVCAAEADAVATDTEAVAEDSFVEEETEKVEADTQGVDEAKLTESAEVLAATTNGWVENSNGTWSYYKNGTMVKSKILKIGNYYYGFNSSGIMYEDTTFSMTNPYTGIYSYHRAKYDGTLYVNTWYEDIYNGWYYYGEAGYGYDGIYTIGGITYFFDYGKMLYDCAISYNGSPYYVRKSGSVVALNYNGWTQVDGNWLYTENGKPVTNQRKKIGGYYYGFGSNGVMLTDKVQGFYNENDVYKYYLFTSDGTMNTKGWYKDPIYGDWYFSYSDGTVARGLTILNGVTYFFSEYSYYMYANTKFTYNGEHYYADSSGVVTKFSNNKWNLCNGRWYYMKDGALLTNGIYEIDGENYWFDYNGVVYTNYYGYRNVNNKTTYYYADANGVLARNEWVYYNDSWYYFDNNCNPVNGAQTIGGKNYYFYNNRMQSDTYQSVNGYRRLYDMNGVMVVDKTGWYLQNGVWYYFSSPGVLASGLITVNGSTYYLQPGLYQEGNYLRYSNKLYRVKDNSGALTEMTQNGWYEDGTNTFYIKDGKLLSNGWVESGTSKYYIYDYLLCASGRYYVDGGYCIFDPSGKVYTNTWLKYGSSYVYASSTGKLVTGKQTIGGVSYDFDSYGSLKTGYQYSGASLTVYTENGTKVYSLKEGWNQVDGSWYYVFNGSIVRSQELTISGFTYRFDSYGKMYTDYIYNDYYYDKNGAMVKGAWIQQGKDWMYAKEDGKLVENSTYKIKDKVYLFDGYYMTTVNDYYYSSYYYVFNTDGSIKSQLKINPNGWNYIEHRAIYMKEGSPYYGWMGNAYFEDGYKVYNDVIYDDDAEAYYCIERGNCVYNKWCNDNSSYAKADGKLAYNEWVCLNGTWYYLDDIYYVTGLQTIGGVTYYFDDYGRLVKTFTTIADGWHQLGDDWYYGRNGAFVAGEYVYDGGSWYYFNYDGAMANSGQYMSNGKQRSFGWASDTVTIPAEQRADYDGATTITNWYYIDVEGNPVYGWQKIGGVTYYFDYAMVTGTVKIYNELHRFASTGAYIGKVTTKNGWYYDGKDYYYFKDGKLIYDEVMVIDGVRYGFDTDGKMVTNETMMDNYTIFYYFFGSSGAQVTTPGIYTDKYGDTLYVGKDGKVYDGYVYVSGQMVGTTIQIYYKY
ncbi:MAG: hypothetical protein E7258_00080 [Lachnospiraceae bacterium]|nr:hypothetical protein [Lachnospiraceae bacterium]